MKLEEIVKSLKVGERVQAEAQETGRAITVLRNDEGGYDFSEINIYIGSFKTAAEMLKYILKYSCYGKWTEYNYKIIERELMK